MALRKDLKINYWGFFGFFGFYGFKEPAFFLFFLFFLFFFYPPKSDNKMAVLMEKRSEDKEKSKQKIMDFVRQNGRVDNDDVERNLGVANATAERYLDELEKEGRLRQIGDKGKGVFYEKSK